MARMYSTQVNFVRGLYSQRLVNLCLGASNFEFRQITIVGIMNVGKPTPMETASRTNCNRGVNV